MTQISVHDMTDDARKTVLFMMRDIVGKRDERHSDSLLWSISIEKQCTYVRHTVVASGHVISLKSLGSLHCQNSVSNMDSKEY